MVKSDEDGVARSEGRGNVTCSGTDENVLHVFRMACSRLFSEDPFGSSHSDNDGDWHYAEKRLSNESSVERDDINCPAGETPVYYGDPEIVPIQPKHFKVDVGDDSKLKERLKYVQEYVVGTLVESRWAGLEFGENERREEASQQEWEELLSRLETIVILSSVTTIEGEWGVVSMRFGEPGDGPWTTLRDGYVSAYGDLVRPDWAAFCRRFEEKLRDPTFEVLARKLIYGRRGPSDALCGKMVSGLIAAGASAGDGSASNFFPPQNL